MTRTFALRLRSLLLPALFGLVLVAVENAAAQNASRGEQLYQQLGCNASSCHGSNPGFNLNGVLAGASSPGAIEYAATVRADMNALLTYFAIDANIPLDLAAYLATVEVQVPPAPPPPPTSLAVEYHHAGFGHYFVTNLASEISALAAGTFAGWARTGKSFSAYTAAGESVAPVCRFFTVAFAPKSSHFYTPFAGECEGLRSGNASWQYEGDGFFVAAADAAGACSTGLRPVYRLYNNGQGGAPNHRYTTDAAVRTEMLAKGWVSEGLGPDGVIFCVPG